MLLVDAVLRPSGFPVPPSSTELTIFLHMHTAGLSGSMKTATELAKTVGCEPASDPWWAPLSNIKFNSQKEGARGAPGAAKRKTPLTMGPKQDDGKSKTTEEHVEAAFFSMFASVFENARDNGLFWLDTHKSFYLKRPTTEASALAPDGTGFSQKQTGSPDPRLIVGIHDNKTPRSGEFTNDDRGKLIRYLGIIMEHYQKERMEIGGSLFDGQYAQCFRLERRSGRGWVLHCSRVLDCATELGATLFAGFLNSKQAHGWHIQAVPTFCADLLGVGTIGAVFAHNRDSTVVVKVPRVKGSAWFKRERDNLKAMDAEGVDRKSRVYISNQDTNDGSHLILEPRLQPTSWPARLHADLSRVADLVEGPVKALHDKGWVHCDLRPDNIMEDLQKRLTLADFGAARRAQDVLLYEHGTLTFASTNVRSHFHDKVAFQTTAADDLESLVYVAYAMMAMSEQEVRDLCILKSDTKRLDQFWDSRFAPLPQWLQLRFAARAGDHGQMAKGLRRLNQVLAPVPEDAGNAFLNHTTRIRQQCHVLTSHHRRPRPWCLGRTPSCDNAGRRHPAASPSIKFAAASATPYMFASQLSVYRLSGLWTARMIYPQSQTRIESPDINSWWKFDIRRMVRAHHAQDPGQEATVLEPASVSTRGTGTSACAEAGAAGLATDHRRLAVNLCGGSVHTND